MYELSGYSSLTSPGPTTMPTKVIVLDFSVKR